MNAAIFLTQLTLKIYGNSLFRQNHHLFYIPHAFDEEEAARRIEKNEKIFLPLV